MRRGIGIAALCGIVGCTSPGPTVVQQQIDVRPAGRVAPWSGPLLPTGTVRWVVRTPSRRVGEPIFTDEAHQAPLERAATWLSFADPEGRTHEIAPSGLPDDPRLRRADGQPFDPPGT